MHARILPAGAVHPDLERSCATHLAGSVSFALSDWVLRVANLPAFRADPTLDLDRLRGEVAPLFDAIVAAIVVSDPFLDDEPGTRIQIAASRHGRQRRQMDIPIGALLTEIQELRRIMLRAMSGWSDAAAGAPALPTLTTRLERAVGIATVAAAEGWVETSDAAARPRPA